MVLLLEIISKECDIFYSAVFGHVFDPGNSDSSKNWLHNYALHVLIKTLHGLSTNSELMIKINEIPTSLYLKTEYT